MSSQVNGPSSPTGKYIDSIDPDDPEYQRQMRRPAEVKEDLKQMDSRSRVKVVLDSDAFREELERIVEEQILTGPHPASLIALQQISELLLPGGKLGGGSGSRGFAKGPIIPINDIRGVESMGYSKPEKVLRCKLASLYRLIDMHGWTSGIYNHISARVNQEQEHFLINPFGVLYSEVSASSLVRVDMQGEVLDAGSTMLGINKAGFILHSAIHQARPDIKCIIHVHTPEAVAVSAMECGLLPLSQEAMICGEISYHGFNGILVDEEERDKLARNLGPTNKVMFLHNHGVVACGNTIEEAYHYIRNVMYACTVQMSAIPAGINNLIKVDSDLWRKTFTVASQGGGGVNVGGRKWKVGELEFEAMMRQLDNAGYRTGYTFKAPLVRHEKRDRSNNDVEIPPSASSFTSNDDSRFMSPVKSAMERNKLAYKAGWLTSPNTYAKQEIEEIGTTNPKKITKWVPESNATTSTPIKLDNPNQFAPQGPDPKEFRNKQKALRKDYYEDHISAGPQSKLLEGISWDEAQKMKEGSLSHTADNVIVVGAASKGIIQRDHQHNAVVYKSRYAANPFENVSNDEIQQYEQEVDRKKRGLPAVDEDEGSPGPDGKLISSDERLQQIQMNRSMDEKQDGSESGIPLEDSVCADVETLLDEIRTTPSVPPKHGQNGDRNKRPEYSTPVKRAESERQPHRDPALLRELSEKGIGRSQSDRRGRGEGEKPGSPAKSDTLRSTDSASGGETLEDRSSKEGSPTKEQASPNKEKEKKKKKKFRMPSFNKKKNKESKESTF
ncbi:alpha-adducin isoform X3 [Patella vulgata]|uniref:alpha-adducin isoform X3 n=1 Tax=Patella vulgata TaxID=6465 RepID=UPI00217F7A7E|nr:alpha-adducin isoform X3 [Patella vulgata]